MYFSQISRPQGPLFYAPIAGVGRCGRLFILLMACVLHCVVYAYLPHFADMLMEVKMLAIYLPRIFVEKLLFRQYFFAAGHIGKDLQVSPSIVKYLLSCKIARKKLNNGFYGVC